MDSNSKDEQAHRSPLRIIKSASNRLEPVGWQAREPGSGEYAWHWIEPDMADRMRASGKDVRPLYAFPELTDVPLATLAQPGEVWFAKVRGETSLVKLEVLEFTMRTVLVRNTELEVEHRYEFADVSFIEKLSAEL